MACEYALIGRHHADPEKLRTLTGIPLSTLSHLQVSTDELVRGQSLRRPKCDVRVTSVFPL